MSESLTPSTEAPIGGASGTAAPRTLLLDAAHNSLVLRTKLRIAWNSVRHIKSHLYLHAFVGIGLMILLLGGGTALFSYIFHWLMRQPVFGGPLMDRLVGIVLLIFFSMLLFSNLIITLSTTYLSKEVEFLMGLPISRWSIFRQKLFESVLYSSWAFAMLSLPLFVSYGIARHAPWFYYPLILPLVIPFLMIPAALGAIFTMIVTSVLPARKTRTLCIVLGILSLALSGVLAKVTGLGQLLQTADRQDFLQIMNVLGLGNSPLLPSAWLSSALQSIAPADVLDRNLGRFAYWMAMLVATALFLIEVCRWLVNPLYYRGWCLSRDAAVKEVESHARFSPFRFVDSQLERLFPKPVAGLLSKDLKSFWRDPAQWTQLVILFGLMIIYITNLGYSQKYSRTIMLVVNDWRLLLSYFNLGATCFILSILTTRFVYPMLSLEGRGFWTVGLAPIPRTHIVWQKFVLCLLLCLGVSVPLMLLSNFVLKTQGPFVTISMIMIVVMSAGLTSISVGIGALLPDLKEDNPARIANGIGGTLNVLLSLVYIGFSVTLLAIPTVLMSNPRWSETMTRLLPVYAGGMILIQAALIWLPMRAGLRRWQNMEF